MFAMARVVESGSSPITRIGRYKASKVGNSYKISIPKEIKEIWQIKENESIDLILYAEERDGDICIIVSPKPLPGDLLR